MKVILLIMGLGGFGALIPTYAQNEAPKKSLDDFFEKDPQKEPLLDIGFELVKPSISWDTGVGLSWMNLDGAKGTVSLGTQVSFLSGFWRFTRIGATLYGNLTHVMVTPGGQYTFYFLSNHFRLQLHGALAVLLGGDTITGAWFNRHTLGLSFGQTLYYYFSSRWGVFLHMQAGLFFPSQTKIRPQIMMGYSHSFF